MFSSWPRSSYLITVIALAIAAASVLLRTDPSPPEAPTREDFAKPLPMLFEAAPGERTTFIGRDRHFALALAPEGASLSLRTESGAVQVRLNFPGAAANPELVGADPQSAVANYFLGPDADTWRRNIKLHNKVRYRNLYPGVDAEFYANSGAFEYDFYVAPGSDPGGITLRFDGAQRLALDPHGDLLVATAAGVLRQHRPVIYQNIAGARTRVRGGYLLTGANEVRFDIGDYDRARTLVIDPVLNFATLLGGSDFDTASRVRVDANGNAYLAGYSFSADAPAGAAYGSLSDINAFVAKYDAAGSLVYITHLGGASVDRAYDLAVDGNGRVAVAGATTSTDFPLANSTLAHNNLNDAHKDDAFVSVLSESGALVYSTLLGGSTYDVGHGIAWGPANLVYVAGETWSSDFPLPASFDNSYDQDCTGCAADTYDGFVAVLDTGNDALKYATYFGGSGNDKLHAVAVDRTSGIAYVAGETNSSDLLPAALNTVAAQNKIGGAFDVAFAAFDPAKAGAASLLYASYLGGGDDDSADDLALNSAGHVYVAGVTASGNFPTKNAYQLARRGVNDAFVAKFNPAASGGLSLLYSTYFGGNDDDAAMTVAVGKDDGAVIAGMTHSHDLPVKSATQQAHAGDTDAFVTRFSVGGNALQLSTYLGGTATDEAHGIAVDAADRVYIAGNSDSIDFKVTTSAAPAGKPDVFLARLAPDDNDVAPTSADSSDAGTRIKVGKGGGALHPFLLFLLATTLLLRRRVRR